MADLHELARQAAVKWANHPDRPRPQSEVAAGWDSLIADWCRDGSLPLFVRKAAGNRGHEIRHRSGRVIVPCDNSPAHWAFASAVLGNVPTPIQIHALVAERKIPVAMIFKAQERQFAVHRCTLGQVVNPNAAGWKVAHIEPIGLNDRTPLSEVGDQQLLNHFRSLMSPRNMFVIPTAYASLAELREMCDAMRSQLEGKNPNEF